MKLEFSFKRKLYSKLGIINKNGTPHVVSICFTMDDEDDMIFNTSGKSIKAQNIRRHNRVRICVDDQIPLNSLILLMGIADIISDKPTEIFKWAKIIAARYMGNDKAEEYGKRNSSEGEFLIKIKPTKVIGQKDIAEW